MNELRHILLYNRHIYTFGFFGLVMGSIAPFQELKAVYQPLILIALNIVFLGSDRKKLIQKGIIALQLLARRFFSLWGKLPLAL